MNYKSITKIRLVLSSKRYTKYHAFLMLVLILGCISPKNKFYNGNTNIHKPKKNKFLVAFLKSPQSGVLYKEQIGDVFKKNFIGDSLTFSIQMTNRNLLKIEGLIQNFENFKGNVDTTSLSFRFKESGDAIGYDRLGKKFIIITGQRVTYEKSLHYENHMGIQDLTQQEKLNQDILKKNVKTIFWNLSNYGTRLQVSYVIKNQKQLIIRTLYYHMKSNGKWYVGHFMAV